MPQPGHDLGMLHAQNSAQAECDAWQKTLPAGKLTQEAIKEAWGPYTANVFKQTHDLYMFTDLNTSRPLKE
jgi:hypothetical protein